MALDYIVADPRSMAGRERRWYAKLLFDLVQSQRRLDVVNLDAEPGSAHTINPRLAALAGRFFVDGCHKRSTHSRLPTESGDDSYPPSEAHERTGNTEDRRAAGISLPQPPDRERSVSWVHSIAQR